MTCHIRIEVLSAVGTPRRKITKEKVKHVEPVSRATICVLSGLSRGAVPTCLRAGVRGF